MYTHNTCIGEIKQVCEEISLAPTLRTSVVLPLRDVEPDFKRWSKNCMEAYKDHLHCQLSMLYRSENH